MAMVYLAEDVRHRREVAVKVLRPDLAATVGAERFLREIEIAARLTHPNILGLHDSGEANEFLYYVMPFVAGASLRVRLDREGTLSIRAALVVIREVSEALGYAHREGVIHRDIKPENILFSEGHAVVADFGIAKAIGSVGGETLTRSGFPLGTPGYMSPEQAAGLTNLDERTDVYGLACVFYEMVVGGTPGLWLTDEAVELGRFVDAEPEHRERLDLMPGRLEQALARSLAMRRRDRYATPKEFVDALDNAGAGSAKLSDTEVSNVLARAADLQAQNPTVDGNLTLGVLEEVGAEVGILPERVRDAARVVAGERAPGDGYGDIEVREILDLAVQQSALQTVEGGALSIGAVEQVGAQVGIQPRYVREAVVGLRRSFAEGRRSVLIASLFDWPTELSFDHVVDGEMNATLLAALTVKLESEFGSPGNAVESGTSFTWTPIAEPEGRDIRVSVRPRGERIRIRVQEQIRLTGLGRIAPYLGTFGGGVIGTALAVTFGAPDLVLVVLPAVLCGLSGADLAAGTVLLAGRKRRLPVLEKIADRIQQFVERRLR